MLFVLNDDLFIPANSLDLIALIRFAAASARHVVLPAEPDSAAMASWISGLGSLRDDVSALFDTFFRKEAAHPSRSVLEVDASYTIAKALDVAKRCFRVYVENSRNDRQFLFAVATEEQRVRFSTLEARGELQFMNGGGNGELRKQLEADIAEGRTLAVQTYVLFDSDTLVPGVPGRDANSLRSKCLELGVLHTLLKRRAIENYLTKAHLRAWSYPANSKPRCHEVFNAYVQLPPELAHHYNMKGGIAQDRKNGEYPPNDAIYSSLSEIAKKNLEAGFGGRVAECFEWPLREDDMKREGSWVELQTIITGIEGAL